MPHGLSAYECGSIDVGLATAIPLGQPRNQCRNPSRPEESCAHAELMRGKPHLTSSSSFALAVLSETSKGR